MEITDRQRRRVDEAFVARVAEEARRLVGGELDELSVVLLDDEGIEQLNRQLLGREGTTDVIAFEAEEDPDARRAEIYINTDAAARQGPEYGHDATWELGFLVAHGVLHALGFSDASEAERQRMFELQQRVMNTLLPGEKSERRAGSSEGAP
ncbi:MAG: rRNA maturation RNase YbeY [Armatimonadetes bacterium]|nr:rRNA maturation RNase YbeY [Armatimonadota bacterium]